MFLLLSMSGTMQYRGPLGRMEVWRQRGELGFGRLLTGMGKKKKNLQPTLAPPSRGLRELDSGCDPGWL